MKIAFTLALIAGAVPLAAVAQGSAPPKGKKEVVHRNGKVCRSIRETGTRVAQSVCRPPEEWAQIDAAAEAARKDDPLDPASQPVPR